MDLVEFEVKAKAAFEQVEDRARQMGLYADHAGAMQMPDGSLVLIVDFTIGDIAFSDRVQNPEQHGTDTMVNVMEKQMHMTNFLDERARIQKALEAGVDPLEAIKRPSEGLGN